MVRINEVADDTGVNYPSLISRRRRPQAVMSVDSGFVLIIVLPVAMLLMMTALSLVTRSNSAAIAAARESRAQAARMAAEYGLNQMLALVNTQYDTSQDYLSNSFSDQPIDGTSGATYTISYKLLNPPPAVTCSPSDDNNSDLIVTVEGKFPIGSTTYKRQINRVLRVCAPPGPGGVVSNRLRVRAIK